MQMGYSRGLVFSIRCKNIKFEAAKPDIVSLLVSEALTLATVTYISHNATKFFAFFQNKYGHKNQNKT